MNGSKESLGVFSNASGGDRFRELDLGNCVGARKGDDDEEPVALLGDKTPAAMLRIVCCVGVVVVVVLFKQQ